MKRINHPPSPVENRGAEAPVSVLPEIPTVRAHSSALTIDAEENPPAAKENFTAQLVVDTFLLAGVMFFNWEPPRGLTFLSGRPPLSLGYTREEVLRDPLLVERIVRPDFRQNISRFITQLHEAAHRVSHLQIPFVAKGGATVWYEARVLPRIGPTGRVEGF